MYSFSHTIRDGSSIILGAVIGATLPTVMEHGYPHFAGHVTIPVYERREELMFS